MKVLKCPASSRVGKTHSRGSEAQHDGSRSSETPAYRRPTTISARVSAAAAVPPFEFTTARKFSTVDPEFMNTNGTACTAPDVAVDTPSLNASTLPFQLQAPLEEVHGKTYGAWLPFK